MSLTVRKFSAQVRDSTTGEMIPAGLLSSDALGAINTAKNTAVAAVQAQGATTIASIPSDYTSLSNEVDDLKNALDSLATYPSKNLVTRYTWTSGRYINAVDGGAGSVASYSAVLDYIPVKPNTTYTITRNHTFQCAVYNSSKTYVSGFYDNSAVTTAYQYTTGATVAYIRVSCETAYLSEFGLYEGASVQTTTIIDPDVIIPEVIRSKTVAITPSNYASLLPDVNNVMESSVYKMYFSTNSDAIPAHLPFDRWLMGTAMLITVAKHTGADGSNAGSQQILIGDDMVFWRDFGSAWTAWDAIYLRIRVGTGTDFSPSRSSLTAAIVDATKYKNAVVEVGAGTFDLYTEFLAYYGNDFFDNYEATTVPRGLHLTNGVRVICSENSKIVFNYPGNNQYVQRWFSPINFLSDCRGGFTLEGARVECSNCRYAIHDDPGDSQSPYHNKYINCKFYIDNTNNPNRLSGSYAVLGGGLGRNGQVEIDNCLFLSADTAGTDHAVVSYHVDVYTTDGNSKVTIRDSYLEKGTFAAYYGNPSNGQGNHADYLVHGNSLYGAVIIAPNYGLQPTENTNINVWAWNNANHAS